MRNSTPTRLLPALLLGPGLALAAAAGAGASYLHETLVVEQDPSPVAGFTYGRISSSDVNAAKDVVFTSLVAGTDGLFLNLGGSHFTVARIGQPAPGFEPDTFEDVGPPEIDTAGRVTFLGQTETESAVFLHSGGVTSPLVAKGDATPLGGTYSGFDSLAMSPGGDVVFYAPVIGGTSSAGLFRVSEGVHSVIAAVGDLAPGGGFYSSFRPSGRLQVLAINAAGDVVFLAGVTGGTAAEGIFRASGGTHSAIAWVGDPAPGTGGGSFSQFQDFPGWTIASFAINAASDVAFGAFVSGGTTSEGIFVNESGVVRDVALHGDPAPDTGGGSYDFAGGLDSLRRKGLADDGRVTFDTFVSGGSVVRGIFTDVAGSDSAVVIAGDPAPAPLGGTYLTPGFKETNADGGVLFLAPTTTCCDPALFYAPEPSGRLALAAGALALWALARRRRNSHPRAHGQGQGRRDPAESRFPVPAPNFREDGA